MVHSLATSQPVLSPNGLVSGPWLLSDEMYKYMVTYLYTYMCETYIDIYSSLYVYFIYIFRYIDREMYTQYLIGRCCNRHYASACPPYWTGQDLLNKHNVY